MTASPLVRLETHWKMMVQLQAVEDQLKKTREAVNADLVEAFNALTDETSFADAKKAEREIYDRVWAEYHAKAAAKSE